MPANSFQNALCPDGKYAVPAGELHLLDEGDRNTNYDINVNPGFGAWVEHDLSARVPKGTKALLGFAYIANTDANGSLHVRDGTSTETDAERTITMFTGNNAGDSIGVPCIIKATDGILDIIERDAASEISIFIFELWGYFL